MFKLLKNVTYANDELCKEDLSVRVSATSVSKQKRRFRVSGDDEAIVTHFVHVINPIHQSELQMVTKKEKKKM